MHNMKHIQNYELFEGETTPAKTNVKPNRLFKNELPTIMKSSFTPDYDGLKSGKWLKDEYDFDLIPLMTQLNKFTAKAVVDQYPNISRGVRAVDFAKYMETNVNKLVSEYVKKVFNGKAKGKKTVIKALYLLSGKDGFVKDLATKYKNKKMNNGQTNLVKTLMDHADLGNEILKLSNSPFIKKIEAENNGIKKWVSEYNKHFTDKNKLLMTALSSVGSGIWD